MPTAIGKVTKEATCTEEGIRTFACVNCGQTRTEKLPARDMGKQRSEGKKLTCASEGYTGDTYCKTCGTRLSGGETIAKTEHSWGEWEKTADATYLQLRKRRESARFARPQKRKR
ncbi:MAG: hypothetical protein ACLRMZ_10955 [Blautia marasmi]